MFSFEEAERESVRRGLLRDAFLKERKSELKPILDDGPGFYSGGGILVFLNTLIDASNLNEMVNWRSCLGFVRSEDVTPLLECMSENAKDLRFEEAEMLELFQKHPERAHVFREFADRDFEAVTNPTGVFKVKDWAAFCRLPMPMFMHVFSRLDMTHHCEDVVRDAEVSADIKEAVFNKYARKWVSPQTAAAFTRLALLLEQKAAVPGLAIQLQRVAEKLAAV